MLIKEPNTSATQWLEGCVESVHPGKNSIIRVASVLTLRPLVKLVAVPSSNEFIAIFHLSFNELVFCFR